MPPVFFESDVVRRLKVGHSFKIRLPGRDRLLHRQRWDCITMGWHRLFFVEFRGCNLLLLCPQCPWGVLADIAVSCGPPIPSLFVRENDQE